MIKKWGYNPNPHKTETIRPLAQCIKALLWLINDFRAGGASAASGQRGRYA